MAKGRKNKQASAEQGADVAICNQTALEGAMLLDRMEEEDTRRKHSRGAKIFRKRACIGRGDA